MFRCIGEVYLTKPWFGDRFHWCGKINYRTLFWCSESFSFLNGLQCAADESKKCAAKVITDVLAGTKDCNCDEACKYVTLNIANQR